MLRTMQSLPPTVFLTSHMVFVKLWEVEEPHDGAVEYLGVICLPLRYRNEWNGSISYRSGGNEHSVCIFLDCVMERLGGRWVHIVVFILMFSLSSLVWY